MFSVPVWLFKRVQRVNRQTTQTRQHVTVYRHVSISRAEPRDTSAVCHLAQEAKSAPLTDVADRKGTTRWFLPRFVSSTPSQHSEGARVHGPTTTVAFVVMQNFSENNLVDVFIFLCIHPVFIKSEPKY